MLTTPSSDNILHCYKNILMRVILIVNFFKLDFCVIFIAFYAAILM